MARPHARHRPRRITKETSGMLSYHTICVPHPGHEDRGRQMLRPSGRRTITTFRKLPMTSPKISGTTIMSRRSVTCRDAPTPSQSGVPRALLDLARERSIELGQGLVRVPGGFVLMQREVGPRQIEVDHGLVGPDVARAHEIRDGGIGSSGLDEGVPEIHEPRDGARVDADRVLEIAEGFPV